MEGLTLSISGLRGRTSESGQASIPLVLMMGTFLLGVLGFAIDLTNVWFHHQSAAAAVDAACQAGAMDMYAGSGGLSLPGSGFTIGTAGNCVSNPTATMCAYANNNGYSGTGLVANAKSNSVSWTFPSSVTGVTLSTGTNAYLTVTISENIKTYFTRILTTNKVMNINVSATCGSANVKDSAPLLVLNPTVSGAFNYGGNGTMLAIIGGPQRGLQVNSSSLTAITTSGGPTIDLSKGGPSKTGSDVGIVGGPTTPTTGMFTGGTTGGWRGYDIPVPDPYSTLAAPASIKLITPAGGTNGTAVKYGVHGCPDHSSTTKATCQEYAPGYYPSGISLTGQTTAIFDPGIYYMNGSISANGGATVRVATPTGSFVQTDGVMFYFFSGSLSLGGNSGVPSLTIDSVPTTHLTCDGTSPPSALGMPATVDGNVLYGQCTSNGTYWDAGNDTTDTISSSGTRGLVVFQAHANASDSTIGGSGALTFSGALYFHRNDYTNVLKLSGNSSSGTYIIGDIVADEVTLAGNGTISIALNPAKTMYMAKVGIF